ncbi:hypothetical protein BJF80_00250 [Serinicoccus sp. CUA-874]|nr:hypothetical protein BJF80_00250 [Serinicoccus sp. CUA-874]
MTQPLIAESGPTAETQACAWVCSVGLSRSGSGGRVSGTTHEVSRGSSTSSPPALTRVLRSRTGWVAAPPDSRSSPALMTSGSTCGPSGRSFVTAAGTVTEKGTAPPAATTGPTVSSPSVVVRSRLSSSSSHRSTSLRDVSVVPDTVAVRLVTRCGTAPWLTSAR